MHAWQLACFEQDIPEVGDHVVYAIAGRELVVVRSAPDEIVAFKNACLHRGRALCDHDGSAPELRCPFHGFTWSLDGTFRGVPPAIAWDYGHVDPASFCLPKLPCETWDGQVFVNFDPDAPSLGTYLGDFAKHFERWPIADRVKIAHVAKVVPCNWKVGLDAFVEVYHVATTHPQTAAAGDGSNCEYDVYPGTHFNRMIAPNFLGNDSLPEPLSQQEILDEIITSNLAVGEPATPRSILAEGERAADHLAQAERNALEAAGVDVSELTDVELTATLQYYLFPNITPWARPLYYRWRPNGDDPNSSIMEIMLLVPWPAHQPRPPAAKVHWLNDDQTWADAPELGVLGAIANQDTSNMAATQRGLRNLDRPITLGRYVDTRIRHYHALLDEYIARGSHRDKEHGHG
jgi:nitrite reductase/ring-hydroxylating ferredoxin subunit